MFRKRKNNKGTKNKNLRRKRNNDDDENNSGEDGDGDDEAATGIAIRKTMKKQKILASLPMTSAGGRAKTGDTHNANESGGGEASRAAAAASSGELSVLATKHRNNMEAFIEQEMASKENEASNETNTNAAAAKKREETDTGDNTNSEKHDIISDEDLYQQLALEVTNAGGDGDNDGGDGDAGVDDAQQQDGDQGAGGAALLVGTGIAEVILPATSHRPAAVPTSSRVWNKNNRSLSSAVPEGERHKHTLPDTTPKPFVKFRKYNNNHHPTNNDANNNNNADGNGNGPTDTNDEQAAGNNNSSSTTRKGFDAFRGRVTASDYLNEQDNDPKHNNKNPRQKKWKTGKDRDDDVYSHFLKKTLNGKRR